MEEKNMGDNPLMNQRVKVFVKNRKAIVGVVKSQTPTYLMVGGREVGEHDFVIPWDKILIVLLLNNQQVRHHARGEEQ